MLILQNPLRFPFRGKKPLVIGQATFERCCCGEAPPVVNVTCQSKTGPFTICGWSGFDDGSYNPASPQDWEGWGRTWGRKEIRLSHNHNWVRRTYDGGGALAATEYFTDSLTGDGWLIFECGDTYPRDSGELIRRQQRTITDYVISPPADSDVSSDNSYALDSYYSVADWLTNYSLFDVVSSTKSVLGPPSVPDSDVPASVTTTLLSKTYLSNGSVTAGIPPDDQATNTAASNNQELLQDEVDLFSASTGTAGSSCEASASPSGSVLSPDSYGNIDYDGTTVRLLVSVSWQAGAEVVVRLNFSGGITSDLVVDLDATGNASVYVTLPVQKPSQTLTYLGFEVLSWASS